MSKPKIKCPTCEKEHIYNSSSSFRPFCSERCKMIDLGAWANEEYSIPESKSVSDYSSGELEEYEGASTSSPTMH
ncbi:MAG: DNA gyrase inhibitor YacG [Neptuniibacter sp.]